MKKEIWSQLLSQKKSNLEKFSINSCQKTRRIQQPSSIFRKKLITLQLTIWTNFKIDKNLVKNTDDVNKNG